MAFVFHSLLCFMAFVAHETEGDHGQQKLHRVL